MTFETGNRDKIAIKIAFEEDPDRGRGASKEDSLSWGSFQFWVDGKNLCQYQCGQQVHQEVNWYLLPVLEWVARQWNPLLHEERFPATTRYAEARSGYHNAVIPTLAVFDESTAYLQEAWEEWWGRHALRSHRDGGIFPDLFIRRARDSVEFSWGNTAVPGTPKDFSFLSSQSVARLEVETVASVLFQALKRAIGYLASKDRRSERLLQLQETCGRIGNTPVPERDAWLIRIGSTLEESKKVLDVAYEAIKTRSNAVIDSVIESSRNDLAVIHESHAVLMFGTVAPTIKEPDVRKLAISIADAFNGEGDDSGVSPLIKSAPLATMTRPYAQGYELALEFMDAALDSELDKSPDLDELTRRLNIATIEMQIEDEAIRGLTIAGPKHRPTILVNRGSAWNSSAAGRRFTIAHELCHLLYDRSYGQRLSMASGPWAPRDVEQRANAFAAMLLMPISSVNKAIRKLDVPLATADAIRLIADAHQTSPIAVLEHLYNLRKLDDADRERVRAEFDARIANQRPVEGQSSKRRPKRGHR
jgi:Zn-dependent peptidase ImmA (M78 family)